MFFCQLNGLHNDVEHLNTTQYILILRELVLLLLESKNKIKTDRNKIKFWTKGYRQYVSNLKRNDIVTVREIRTVNELYNCRQGTHERDYHSLIQEPGSVC